jgi:hypothetical protein
MEIMAVRMKTRWHRSRRSRRNIEGSSREKSPEDLAGVIAFNIWKLARETFHHMDKEGFRFEDREVIGVITEMIAFLIQVADRLVYGRISDDERAQFINSLARTLAQTVQSNQEDLFGPADYISPFVAVLNDRFAHYAECSYDDTEGPGYAFRRYLGERVAEAMAGTDNKWVIEHVMEIEAPDAVKNIRRLVTDVMGLRTRSNPPVTPQ